MHTFTDEGLAAHDAEVLADAGVTQPEPEYEYGPGYKEANGRWFAEYSLNNYADDQQVHLLRRVKAGAWELMPNQTGEADGRS